MNKPIRKLTTKKLFGTKVHDDIFMNLENSSKYYLNGNLFEDKSSGSNTTSKILFFEKGIDWLSDKWNWMTFGLYRGSWEWYKKNKTNSLIEYSYDHLPLDGYGYMKNILKDITENIKKKRVCNDKNDFTDSYSESFYHPGLIQFQSMVWIDGDCKANLGSKSVILNGTLDCLEFGYGMEAEDFKIQPNSFIAGYDVNEIKGTFLFKK